MKIDGIAAVVTGGASGLGEATARMLAGQGAKVAIFDMNEAAGEAVAGALGGVFAKVDVSDPVSVAKGFERARAAHGQERVLVNCAGIAPPERTVTRDGAPHAPMKFAKVVGVNLIGTFYACSTAAAGMAASEPANEDGERGVI
ncbi:MAG: SDR family NAD(P)-dependent oxidoreductase, partial [Pikeienuella sp.]